MRIKENLFKKHASLNYSNILLQREASNHEVLKNQLYPMSKTTYLV